MSKISNALCTLALVGLSMVSCSTLLKRPNAAPTPAEPVVESDSLQTLALDSLSLAEQEALVVDPLSVDSLEVEAPQSAATIEDEEVAQEEIPAFEPFHFEGSETYSVQIDEFRHTIVRDTVINLREWDSHYPADGYVTSNYGWRHSRMHAGIDLKAYTGDNLYAAFDGVVRLAKYYSSFGNCIIIRHYNGLETLYAHASKLLVKVNDQVKAGDVIALAGNTGRSTGSHLHFETRINGNYFNPTYILDTKARQIKDTCLYLTMRNGRLFASNNDDEQEREAVILREISIRYYTVRKGDVLSRIAINNGTTVAAICRLNGIRSTSTLRIGQRLIVRDGIKPPATSSSATSAKSSTKSAPASSAATYVIRRGDSLSSIAKRHGTTIEELCALNGITRNTIIKEGERLTIRTKGGEVSSGATSIYTVRAGDNLSSIAKRHGTTVTKICSLNGISRNSTLSIGQKLKLSSSSAAQGSSTAPQYHKVRKGDTLSQIAQRNSTTIDALCRLNGISRNSTLQINQRLRVR